MIIVNTGKTYPPIAYNLLTTSDHQRVLAMLADVTSGDWPNLSDEHLETFGDYLVGTCDGRVTVAYKILGFSRRYIETRHQGPRAKVRFSVEPATDLAWLIGRSQPGGPWRQGEARGTRRVALAGHEIEEGRLDYRGTWVAAVAQTARSLAANHFTDVAPPNAAFEAHIRPDGVVVLEVPAGTPVLIQPH